MQLAVVKAILDLVYECPLRLKKKLKLRTFLTYSVTNLTSALVSSEHFKMYVTDEC